MIAGTYDFTLDIIAEDIECANQQGSSSAGRGGKAPSPVSIRQSMKTSRKPGSSRFAASPTESGLKARSSRPASGGSPVKPTPKPESFSPMKSAEPKSTAGQPIRGEHGRG